MLKMIILALSLSLLSCKEVQYLYVIDTDNAICSKREITNKETFSSQWVEDLPIEACDGNISVTAEDFARLTGRKSKSLVD